MEGLVHAEGVGVGPHSLDQGSPTQAPKEAGVQTAKSRVSGGAEGGREQRGWWPAESTALMAASCAAPLHCGLQRFGPNRATSGFVVFVCLFFVFK